MDAYQKLRVQARHKRDAAIQSAHDEYAATLRTIAALRKNLGPEGAVGPVKKSNNNYVKGQRAVETIKAAIPRGCQFSTGDLTALLRAAGHEIADSSLRSHLRRLEDQRTIERIRRDADGQIIWVATGEGSEPETPVAAMNLPDAAAAVLAESKPLKVTELAIAIQGRGCRAGASRQLMTESLVAALRDSSRFRADGDGRWSLLSDQRVLG